MQAEDMDVATVTVKAKREGEMMAVEVALVDEKGEQRRWEDFKHEVEQELFDGLPASLFRSSTFEARLTQSAWQVTKPAAVFYAKLNDGAASPSAGVPSPSASSADPHRLATLGAPSMTGVLSSVPAVQHPELTVMSDGERRLGRSAPSSPYATPTASPSTSRRTSLIEVSSDDAACHAASFASTRSSPHSASSSTARVPSRTRSSRPSSLVKDDYPFPLGSSGCVTRFKSLSGEFEDRDNKFGGHTPPASRAPSRDGLARLPHGLYDSRSASEESLATPAEGEPLSSSRPGNGSGLQGIEAALADVDFSSSARRSTEEVRARKVKTCGNLNRGYSCSSPSPSRAPSPARPALVTTNSNASSTSSSYSHLPSLAALPTHLPLHLSRNDRPSSPHPLASSSSNSLSNSTSSSTRTVSPSPALRSVSTHAVPLRSALRPATASGTSSQTSSPSMSPHPRVSATTAPWVDVTSTQQKRRA